MSAEHQVVLLISEAARLFARKQTDDFTEADDQRLAEIDVALLRFGGLELVRLLIAGRQRLRLR